MRTTFDIEFLTKIYENPSDYIGQRNLNLLYCFIPTMGELKFEIPIENKSEYESMPNFRSFIENKTNIELTASLHWRYALGFNTEDQRSSFEHFFQLLFDYESTYPIDYSKIKLITNDILSNEFSPIEDINFIVKRSQLFEIFGIPSLRAFIDGYIYRMEKSKLDFSETELKIIKVINGFKSLKSSLNKFETWDRIILREKMNISEFTNSTYSGTWAMKRFIEILEQEAKVKFKTSDE